MAFGSKGWRKIVVANEVFFWQPNDDIGSMDRPTFLLQARVARKPNRYLAAFHPRCGHWDSSFNWRVTPQITRCCIETAIHSGWLTEHPRLRVVFFAPLRCLAHKPEWLTSTVMQLVRSIHGKEDNDRFPILADALQDAGCDSDEILNHFRDPNANHHYGCWALSLVLGRK